MTARLVAIAVALTVALTGTLTVHLPRAQAAWSTTGSGATVQAAMAMPAGATPTVTVASVPLVGMVYTLRWPTAALHAGQPVTGYRITRSATLGGSVLSSGTCSGLTVLGVVGVFSPADAGATTQSCTDTSAVNLGTVRYAITPVYSRWVGQASPWSAPIG